MKKLSALLLIAAMLLTMFTLTACGEKQIDLREYTTVEFTGIDGEGEASIDFDRNALGMAFIEASGIKDTFNKQAVELAGKLSAFINTIDYQVAPKENLKNGDEVTVTFSYDEKAAQTAGVAPQNATYTVTVAGLTEAIEVDAFDPSFFNTERGVMIQYSGIVPEGHLEISNKLDKEIPAHLVSYECDSYDVAYGENVTITASLPSSAKEEGYVLKEETYEFPLKDIAHYMTDTSELNTDKTQLKNDLIDAFTAHGTDAVHITSYGDWGNDNKVEWMSATSSVKDIAIDNIYCLKEKDGCYRNLYVTMHATATVNDKTYPITAIYEVRDFYINADGTLHYTRDYMDGSYYSSEEKAYEKELTPQLMQYNIDKVAFENAEKAE